MRRFELSVQNIRKVTGKSECGTTGKRAGCNCRCFDGRTSGTGYVQKESDVEEQINPWLLRFLDTDTMEEKYQIVCDIKNDITDRLIDDLAVAVDVVIPEGKLSDRYEQLKYCIRTRQKYEQTSLWRK